jgi:C4-dicarboxylate-binding protein DctP
MLQLNNNGEVFKMKAKLLVLALISVLIISLGTGCGAKKEPVADKPAANSGAKSEEKAPAKQVQMRIGYLTGQTHPEHFEMTEFKKRVEAKVGEQLKVGTFGASQLGNPGQLLQGLASGTIEAVIMPTAFYGGMAPEVTVLDLPGLFSGSDKAYSVMNSTSAGEGIKKALDAKGITLLGYFYSADKDIVSTVSLENKAAFKGRKIRTLAAPVLQDQINMLGGAGVPLDPGEVYTALQQKTIEGVFSDMHFWSSMKLHEVAKFRLEAPKGVIMSVLCVNKKWFESLPADVQKAIQETVKEVLPVAADHAKSLLKDELKMFTDAGGKTIAADSQFNDDLNKMYQEVTDKFVKEYPQNKAIIEAIKAASSK